MTSELATDFPTAKRVVVKIGSSTLMGQGGHLDDEFIADLSGQIAHLVRDGVQVVLVTSGAIAAGLAPLGF